VSELLINQINYPQSKLYLPNLEQWKKCERGKIPLPDFWGDYRVTPQSIEFWRGEKTGYMIGLNINKLQRNG